MWFRATFIILEKIQHLREQSKTKIQTPSGSERLFDLIQVKDPEILVAFYFALTDTLVTTDNAAATKYVHVASFFFIV